MAGIQGGGYDDTDGGGHIEGTVLLIREFESTDSASGTPHPTGYFRIEFSKDTSCDAPRERQQGNPRDLKVVKTYSPENALAAHTAAKDAMKNKKVEEREGSSWFFLPPDGNEKWSTVEDQITKAIEDYHKEWGLSMNK